MSVVSSWAEKVLGRSLQNVSGGRGSDWTFAWECARVVSVDVSVSQVWPEAGAGETEAEAGEE